jgi:hypothetical protein
MAVFSEAFLRLRQEFDQAEQKRAELIHEIRAGVRRQARQTGEQLAQHRRTRRAEFAAMRAGLRSKIQEQAAGTRQWLAALTADLRQAGTAFGRR